MYLRLGFLATLALLAGCAFTPPKPPPCVGDFRPVNAPAQQGDPLTLNRADSAAMCKGAAHA